MITQVLSNSCVPVNNIFYLLLSDRNVTSNADSRLLSPKTEKNYYFLRFEHLSKNMVYCIKNISIVIHLTTNN